MNGATKELLSGYFSDLEKLNQILKKLNKNERNLSLLRLITAVVGVAVAIPSFQYNILMGFSWLSIVAITFFIIFLRHEKAKRNIELNLALKKIKENEISTLTTHKNIFPDGSKYINPNHDYTDDLDIFGKNSLHALINRCSSQWGNDLLADILSSQPSIDKIIKRQEAINELSTYTHWRDLLIARLFLIDSKTDSNLLNRIQSLTSQNYTFLQHPSVRMGITLVPIFWLICVVMFLLSIPFTSTIALGGAILIFSIYLWHAPKVNEIQHSVSTGKNYISEYLEVFHSIYNQQWKSSLLNEIIKKDKGSNQIKALTALDRIIDKLDYRLNMIVGFILNLTMFWDFRIVRSLRSWSIEYEEDIPELFSVLGNVEALTSLAIWKYNHPHYTMPLVSEDVEYHMTEVRHPLMQDEQCIPNDFFISSQEYINIITGSNMSGKSTLLRTIGVNMVLSYSGTVVDASEFKIPLVRIISYMRIKDALEESISTFKAELNRVKMILDSLNKNDKSIYLIDEMLRGTNSKDKLKGSIAITKKILTHEAYAIIATHDIQLAELGLDNKEHIKNYYFDIEFQEEELVFDYKLKEGICSNFNASHLLKQIGVE